MAFPTFEVAKERLQGFLSTESWPIQIEWVAITDIKPISPSKATRVAHTDYSESLAKQHYQEAVSRGFGVAFEGLCASEGKSFIAVTWPQDEEESEYLMYCETDLKLSLRASRPTLIEGRG